MKNIINYFYDINIIEIYKYQDKFFFNYNGNNYKFIKYDRDKKDIKSIINICEQLKIRNILTNELICNKFNNYLTPVNGIFYIMIKENVRRNSINFNDILYIQANTLNISQDKNIIRSNCIKLWENKIDFYERKLKQLNKNYELINKSFDYYIGLGENAIIYLRNNNIRINDIVLSHRRLEDYYDPTNYILDSRARDVSDYIKTLFFYNDVSEDFLLSFFKYINFNREEYIIIIARMLYPTYYFDLVDRVLLNNEDEEILKNIINKSDKYNNLLKRLFYYINYDLRMNIPMIEWIIKKHN